MHRVEPARTEKKLQAGAAAALCRAKDLAESQISRLGFQIMSSIGFNQLLNHIVIYIYIVILNSLMSIAYFVHLVYLQMPQRCCLDFRNTCFDVGVLRGAEASCLGRICRLCEAWSMEKGEMKRRKIES